MRVGGKDGGAETLGRDSGAFGKPERVQESDPRMLRGLEFQSDGEGGEA